MHVAGLAIYDPANVPGYSFDKIKDMVTAALHLAPPFRRRLVTVPFGLHHPLWIEDPDFDLDYHIRHIGVPPPGRPARAGRARRPPRARCSSTATARCGRCG